MPSAAERINRIGEILYARAGNNIYHKPNGAILLRKLGIPPLSFLHKLFEPKDIGEYEKIMPFSLSGPVKSLFSFTNGAILFDNTFFIYGIAGSFNRSISADMIQPISLQEEIELQLQRGAADTEVPIGSVAAATKNYHLVLYNTGQAAISQPTGERLNFGDITEAVLTIVEICDAICGEDGLIDSSGKELERILDTLVGQGKSLH